MELDVVLQGNSLEILQKLEPESVDMVFTSPSPFNYGGQGIGSEDYQSDYLDDLEELFDQVYQVLKPTGCLWVNIPDTHVDGILITIPEDFVARMVCNWIYRSNCYWVRTEKFDYQEDYNRFTRDVEHLYFFTKSKDHYFNNPKNKIQSSVFRYPYKPTWDNPSGFPQEMIERCIHLGCPPNGIVLDPLAGSGITGVIAKRMNRRFILIDLDEIKVKDMKERLGVKY